MVIELFAGGHMDTIGVRIRELRKRRLLSQAELAHAAGIERVTISELEQGKRQPHGSTVRKIASALGVDAEMLAYGETDTTYPRTGEGQ